jgi:ABC-type dipeptide/oligopeptide/nickel transport system ATPase component
VNKQKFRAEPVLGRRQRFLLLGEGDSQEWVTIGRLAEIGPLRDVRLDVTREHVLAIVGKRGSGKSFTLGTFIEGLCTRVGSTVINQIGKTRASLLFDTLNIFQWMVAPVSEEAASRHVDAQAKLLKAWGLAPIELDVDLWIPAGFEDRNLGRASPFRIRTADMEAADWAALIGVDALQDVMGQLLSLVIEKTVRRGWKSEDGSSFPPNPQYELRDLIDCLSQDQEVARDYARETIRAIRQRLSAYDASPLFGPGGTSLVELLSASPCCSCPASRMTCDL